MNKPDDFSSARGYLIDLIRAKDREREAIEILKSATQSRKQAEAAFANALVMTVDPEAAADARAAILSAMPDSRVSANAGSN